MRYSRPLKDKRPPCCTLRTPTGAYTLTVRDQPVGSNAPQDRTLLTVGIPAAGAVGPSTPSYYAVDTAPIPTKTLFNVTLSGLFPNGSVDLGLIRK